MTETQFMPKATAVWLVENTTLTFKQIAEFCNLHELEVKGIADGDVAKGIKAYNPILAGQNERECTTSAKRVYVINLKLSHHKMLLTQLLSIPTIMEIVQLLVAIGWIGGQFKSKIVTCTETSVAVLFGLQNKTMVTGLEKKW